MKMLKFFVVLCAIALVPAVAQNPVVRYLSCPTQPAGGTDAYACALYSTTGVANYAAIQGKPVWFRADVANTGAASLNLSSLGAITIKKVEGGVTTDLADNDIRAGQWVQVTYDGTNFQMMSQAGNAPSGGSGLGYTLTFRPTLGFNPADASTYYMGATVPLSDNSWGKHTIWIPKSCTLKSAWFRAFLGGTTGSGETVTVDLMQSAGTTNNPTSATSLWNFTQTWDSAAGIYDETPAGFSAALTQGRWLVFRIATPTWTTNPTTVYLTGQVYCE